MGNSTCSIDGCEYPQHARGWCLGHYGRWAVVGDPLSVSERRRARVTCSVDGCEELSKDKGWCKRHLARWKRYGDPTEPPKKMPATGQVCSVEGCVRPVKARGLCGSHHELRRMAGVPPAVHMTASTERPAWPTSAEDCIEWTGTRNGSGYGTFGRSHTVHREVFIALTGTTPEVVRHSCDNPICYRFEHLIGGTHADNSADRSARGRTALMIEERERRREWRKRELHPSR